MNHAQLHVVHFDSTWNKTSFREYNCRTICFSQKEDNDSYIFSFFLPTCWYYNKHCFAQISFLLETISQVCTDLAFSFVAWSLSSSKFIKINLSLILYANKRQVLYPYLILIKIISYHLSTVSCTMNDLLNRSKKKKFCSLNLAAGLQ